MRTTSYFSDPNTQSLHFETNLLQLYDHWYSEISLFNTSPEYLTESGTNTSTKIFDFLTTTIPNLTKTEHFVETTSLILPNGLNCTNFEMFLIAKNSYKPIILTLNIINYIIIIFGIFFNTINLIVLLKSKLNESPYSYLTMLALSDLGALSMVGAEKLRQFFPNSNIIHIYFVMMINIFLSCSMYVTLALTIERFIFVHSPFKAMTICRKSIARKICCVIFLFSVLRSTYLPLMYSPNCWSGFSQKKDNFLDLYEFLISLAIPYTIIFIANISLILSLKKQNNLMSVPTSTSTNSFNIKNSEIILPRTRISQEYEPIFETEKKLSCKSTVSIEVEPNNPSKPKVLVHSNTLNSIATTSSKTKKMSLYHRTSNTREIRNQKKLTVTLVIILCLLLVCYLPSFLFEESLADFIFGSHDQPTQDSIKPFIIKAIGNRIAIILIYFNCMANFLIYCFCNKKFKNSLKILLRKSILNKLFGRIVFFFRIYCLKRDESQFGNDMDNKTINNTSNNTNCSYYNSYYFKYYQQNKFKCVSMKERIENNESNLSKKKKAPIVRKAKSMVI
ncbi:unnamed protein product [Brachionus calyciflorus]|uniref:G-protein coupled receptors family 1 profile domain-containing protein n=1 Tax=Brachionus calyciflorus TaxID=104777 RepID=A0A813UA97_9BILA|nr:unnamed protein product [Brachionus calyciflorus]